ncbi:hypothetical protein [Microbacterium sp. cx-59]|uniref:hypothetical protein n=1 Tax=Microbacterium sp. cx-59 TaxID=2891207 RepID=UPI001E5D174A|nr:hypothetical protein [Microbacterium sp. cx-59]MCC4907520.1 hypothetical protein [Microbacterium sp. cx-59]
MSIAMSFDQLDTATDRLRAAAALTEGSVELPTDAGVYASDVLAAAAASYELAIDRLRAHAAAQTTRLADGLAGARSDMASFEQGVIDQLATAEVPSA